METKIQHVVVEMSSTPRNGEWLKPKVLPAYIPIPKTLLEDKKLLLGAKLLWGVIQQHLMPDWRCYASDETFGRILAVSDRHIRTYLRQLESARLLRTTLRPGKTPIRELLWHSRFEAKTPGGRNCSSGGGGTTVPGGRNHSSGVYKEVKLIPKLLPKNSGDDLKKPTAKDPPAPEPKLAAEWSEEDYIRRGRECGFPEHVIQRDLENMRKRKANPKGERMLKVSEVKPKR